MINRQRSSMNKQRVKRLQMPSSLEHLQTFDERPNMSTEQRKAAKAAAAG